MKRFPVLAAVIILLAVQLLPGCSKKTKRPPTYPVSGTVTWKSQPLADARVVFVPTASDMGQEAAAGITDAAGKYQLTTYVADDGAQTGDYKIKVSKYDSKAPTAAEKQQYQSYEEEQKRTFAADEMPTPPAKNLLPKKYESESTSGLTHTVTKGPSTKDIAIE